MFDKSRLFNFDVLLSIAREKYNDLLALAVSEMNLNSYAEIYSTIWKELSTSYRNDFVFRSIIVSKILLARHKLTSTVLLNEVKAGQAIADMVVLNGSSTAYEIKSDLDNWDRVEHQVTEYLKVFDKVFVVTGEHRKFTIPRLDEHVGILLIDNKNRIKRVKDAISNKNFLCQPVMFETLRKPEYLSIVKEVFGLDPQVPNTRINKICKDIFCKLPPAKAHSAMLSQLKKRCSINSYVQDNLNDFPPELHYPLLRYRFSKEDAYKLQKAITLNRRMHVLSDSSWQTV